MEMNIIDNYNMNAKEEIVNGNIQPIGVFDSVVWCGENEIRIISKELNDIRNDLKEVILFFWNYDDNKALYFRNVTISSDEIVAKIDRNLYMQMQVLQYSSMRVAMFIRTTDGYACGYVRNIDARDENLSDNDRIIGRLFEDGKISFITYWTEGGLLSVKGRVTDKFESDYYCLKCVGFQKEGNSLSCYVESPLIDGNVEAFLTRGSKNNERISCCKVIEKSHTSMRQVLKVQISFEWMIEIAEDIYYLLCKVGNHRFDIKVDHIDANNLAQEQILLSNGQLLDVCIHDDKNNYLMVNTHKIYPVMLSVVTAVYNTAPFLAEMINSVLNQDVSKLNQFIFGKGNDYNKAKYLDVFEFILVDDGATDGSSVILDDYAGLTNKIKVIHKENGGVSSARNAGIDLARGKYVNFADSDDMFTKNFMAETLMFFEKHEHEVDIVTTPMIFFDAAKGDHWTNYKFEKNNCVIDLADKPDAISVFVCSSIFKSQDVKNHYFDTNLINGEDIVYIHEILVKGIEKIGAVNSCHYNYRRRSIGEPSAINQMKDDPRTYTDYLYNVMEKLALYSNEYKGNVPKYIQYLIMGQLQWKFGVTDKAEKAKEVLGEVEFQRYKSKLIDLLKYIDDDVILNQKKIWNENKYYILKKKYNTKPQYVYENNDINVYINNNLITTPVGNCYIRLEFIKLNQNNLVIEGYSMSFEKEEELIIRLNGQEITYERINRDVNRYSLDEICFYATAFKAIVPLDRCVDKYAVSFQTKIGDFYTDKKKMRYAKTMPLAESYGNSYYSENGWTIRKEQNVLAIYNLESESDQSVRFEDQFVKQLQGAKDYDHIKKIVDLRKRAIEKLAFRDCKKKIWLISDRVNVAGDNGEAIFRYLHSINDETVDAYFVIDEDCEDFTNLKEFGKVIARGSEKHLLLQLVADFIVSSAADEFVINPWTEDKAMAEVVRDFLARPKYIFLQHGITKDDQSTWLNRYNKHIDGLVCAAPREAQSMLDYKYYYDKQNIWLTGFPRHDRLYRNDKKQVVIMPTWRQDLSDNSGVINKLVNGFTESQYFTFYNTLINNERLLTAAEETGYKICFMPHPGIKRYGLQFFHKDERVDFLDFDKKYCDVYAEASLVMTDYSSSVMDFALLRKPVVYCQFDKDEFFKNHIYTEGYYDYEKDGFGEVTYDMDSLIDVMISYMRNDCKVSPEYQRRMDTFFGFNDKDNSKRVYEMIKKLSM